MTNRRGTIQVKYLITIEWDNERDQYTPDVLKDILTEIINGGEYFYLHKVVKVEPVEEKSKDE